MVAFRRRPDFVFAYIENDWPADVVAEVTKAFEDALELFSTIKQLDKLVSTQDVVNGLYLLDQPSMAYVMNHIDGMKQLRINELASHLHGTAAKLITDFFNSIFGGFGGDLAPLLSHLTTQMGDMQAQTRKSAVTGKFGTVVGLVSYEPELDIPITIFKYVYSSPEVSQWFVGVQCGSVEETSFDYYFTEVEYEYQAPEE